jgi:uncharacterized delta-60 repeat protein
MKRRDRFVTTFAFVAAIAGLGACTAILGDFTTSPATATDSGPGADVLTESSVVSDGGVVFAINAPNAVFVQPGKTASVAITVTGNTTSGPITVNASGLPAGVTAAALTINGSSGNLALTAAASATVGAQAAASLTASESGTTASPIPLNVVVSGASGTVDTTFPAVLPYPSGLGTIASALLQADGKILLVGTFHTNPGDAPQLVIRLNTDGTRDTTYQSLIGTNATASPIAQGIKALLQPDGKVLVAWTEGTSGYVNITRLLPTGALDGTWHDPTKATVTTFDDPYTATTPDPLVALALGADGSVIYAQGASSVLDIWRWTSSGVADTTIGTLSDYGRTSVGTSNPVQEIDYATAAIPQPDGGTYFVGFGSDSLFHNSEEVFARTTPALTLDPTFGPLADAGEGAATGWEFGESRFLTYESVMIGSDLYSASYNNNTCTTGGLVTYCTIKWTLGPDARSSENAAPASTSGLGCGDKAIRIAVGPNKTIVTGGFGGSVGGIPLVARFTTSPLAADTTFGTSGVAKLRASGSTEATETPGAVLVTPEGLIYAVNQDTQYPIQRVWP